MVVELGIFFTLALLGVVIAWWRGRMARRRLVLSAGQRSSLLPPGEFAVWPLRWGVAARKPSTVMVRGATVSLTPPGGPQQAWQVPAAQLRVRVLRPTPWVDVTRFRLSPAGRRPLAVRVSRETTRPLGELDRQYEQRPSGYAAQFEQALRQEGAVVE